MTRRKKGSPAAAVVRQAERKTRVDSSDILSSAISGSEFLRSRVDESPDPETGMPRLRVILLKPQGPVIYDFSQFLGVTSWGPLLAEGFRIRSETSAQTTIYTEHLTILKLSSFLKKVNTNPENVDEAFWASLLSWLNAPHVGGQPRSQKTRKEILGILHRTIKALLDHPQHNLVVEVILFRSGFPKNPWPSSDRKVTPTPVLKPDERIRLIKVCLAEIQEIRERYHKNEEAISTASMYLKVARAFDESPDYNYLSVCAARVQELTKDKLMSLLALRRCDIALWAAFVRHNHSIAEARQMLYSTNRDLVPFIVLLAIRTAFNPATLLRLNWANISESHDGRLISITGKKPRAGSAQTSSQEEPSISIELQGEPGVANSFYDILRLLKLITERTRRLANSADRDLLFIAAQTHSNTTVSGCAGHGGFGARIPPKAFSDFRKLHGLPDFNLKMLRATEAEAEYMRTGDLLSVRDRMGHKNAKTTRTHYTSDWVRRQGQDRIGATQELLVRWAGSEGQCDPRGLRDPSDAPSATRGFGCMDPYDSPRGGQVAGLLCRAYGECPSCPLMIAKPYDEQSVSYYLALQRVILEGRQNMGSANAWVNRWGDVFSDINRLIKEIPAELIASASRFHVTLPPIL